MREKKKLKSCRLEKCVLLILDTEHKVDVLINSVWSKMKARELVRKLFEEIVCKYLKPSIWNVHIGNFLYVVQLYVYKMLKKISILNSEHERTVAELCVNTFLLAFVVLLIKLLNVWVGLSLSFWNLIPPEFKAPLTIFWNLKSSCLKSCMRSEA